jgi:hypothetical protein
MMVARAIVTMVVVGGVVIGAGAGLQKLQDQVRARQVPAEPTLLQVRFAQAPMWMPVSLRNDIASKLVPPSSNFGEPQLAQKIFDLAKQQPWIRHVQFVQKAHTSDPNVGLVEIGAQFRLPIARVQKDNRYYYIDSEAVPLPVDQVPRFVTSKDVCYLEETEIPPDTKYSTIHYPDDSRRRCGSPKAWPALGRARPGRRPAADQAHTEQTLRQRDRLRGRAELQRAHQR